MKKSILFLALILTIVVSCTKEDDPDTTGPQTPLNFVSLTAADTLIAINGTTTITAVATGDELTYSWDYAGPVIIPASENGSVVTFTVCHSDKFKVTCNVKDKYNNEASKDIYIYVK